MRFALEAGPRTLELAQQHGLTGVPVSGADLLGRGVAATLVPLKERGLQPCQIGCFEFNPLRADSEQKARLERLIGLAADTGCPWIAITGGSHCPALFGAADPRNFSAEALDRVASALAPLAAAAERAGVFLTIEPYLKSVAGTPARCAELVSKVGSPALRITFDPTSLYDFAALVNPAPFVDEMARVLAGCVGLVHLKEVALAEGFHLHAGLVPLGQGATDWSQVLRLVAPIQPADSWVVIEHVAPEYVPAALALVRTAAGSC
jgi:sugar phosphate isomerase/epimerase